MYLYRFPQTFRKQQIHEKIKVLIPIVQVVIMSIKFGLFHAAFQHQNELFQYYSQQPTSIRP